MFISPKGMRFATKESALRHVDTEKKASRYEDMCTTGSEMNDVDKEEPDRDEPVQGEEPDGDKPVQRQEPHPDEPVADEGGPALTMASSNYFDDWHNRGSI